MCSPCAGRVSPRGSVTSALYSEETDLDRLVEALAAVTGMKAG
ncbi:hypothetical protein ACVWWO_003517 [Bradyrhizobium sp. F1.13.1]